MNNPIFVCPSCGHRHPIKSNPRLNKQRMQAAKALANHLAFSLNIPDSTQLVFILGSGRETTNHAALEHWVLTKLAHLTQWPMPADEVHALITDLERELRDMLSDLEHGRFYV